MIDKVNELWYNNPSVLFDNMTQILPLNSLSPNQKINSLVRLSIYYIIIVLLLNTPYDRKILLSVSIIIILSSFLIKSEEAFNQNLSLASTVVLPDDPKCQKPTPNNPFMNFTSGDFIQNPNRERGCSYVNNRDSVKQNFNKLIDMPVVNSNNIWSNDLSDRNFYTMPNTGIVNEQEQFAKWIFGDSGKCKTTGNDCLKVIDPIYHIGRLTKT